MRTLDYETMTALRHLGRAVKKLEQVVAVAEKRGIDLDNAPDLLPAISATIYAKHMTEGAYFQLSPLSLRKPAGGEG